MTFEIQELIYTMVNQNQIIMLQWIPSHKNIKGNEIVDQAAKKAHKIRYPITIHEDTKKQIKQMKKKNQRNWKTQLNTILNTKNYLLQNTEPQPWLRSKNRKLDVCITRIITKHTRLNKHLHRMKITNDPYCRWCHNQEEDIEHLILHCPRFHSSRTKLKEALRKIKVINPNINLLFTGADLSPTEKFYSLRHTKIFLRKTKLTEII
jgi:ribonuclease HI